MNRRVLFPAFSLTLLLKLCIPDYIFCNYQYNSKLYSDQDTLYSRQSLYNGRIWRDIYSHKVNGDQYLYSKEFLAGSVTFNERQFKNLKLRYDILNDEIMILTDAGNVLQLNKEMVDSFDIGWEDKTHYFIKSMSDSIVELKGYSEVLYNGKTTLYIKHVKKIFALSQGSNSDVFKDADRIYLFKNGKLNRINSRKDFIILLADMQPQITSFIRTNKLKISKKTPDSFVRVLMYYDSLIH